ncbi:hypothetical protein FFI89_000020 [Bradyrhizobium sp. KBS0727]|nr:MULTISPECIES: hypothetical protein [unclassified Bradyrhizobium]QDW41725.1 hypothetical protein FFI71_000020 [Bradyrhizobium sp. KBS0725]QDW48333.1 hypothetical protein FFI89_000020 [Bradyrhizobium sp. KBS0727]
MNMPETKCRIIPARARMLPLILLFAAGAVSIARADDGMVDVRSLPRLDGAVEDVARTESYRLKYGVPTVVAITTAATRKLLATDGWVPYLRPLDEKSSSLTFKKAQQGLYVSFSQGLGRPDQSAVYYSAERITANVPFPPDATDIIFDEHRPYLGCIAPAAFDVTLDFYRKEMAAIGWKPLSATDAVARWPNALLSERVENGARAYYSHDDGTGFYRQAPVMLTLQRRDDGRTAVDIRVAPFALPQTLEADSEMAALPRPKPSKTAQSIGDSNSPRRKLEVAVIAELAPTLAFFRKELAARNWKEEAAGAVITADEVTLNFSSAEENAVLKLGRRYDMTLANLATQLKESAIAARAKAKKDADDNFFKNAEAAAKQVIAADEVRRTAQAANLSDAPLHALADNSKPVPLPENAENVKFDGADGRLEFDSSSSVRVIAGFYRDSLKSQGWKEQPSVINKSNMVVMEFSRGGKALSFTAMQMGPKVNVSADGSGLVMANAKTAGKPTAAGARVSSEPADKGTDKGTDQVLEADADSALPVPKQHTMSSIGTGKVPGSNAPIRKELEASIPAELNNVLGFYRTELGKLGWKEATEGAVVTPDQVQLAFISPDGPATLKLGRSNGETSVSLAQKYPAVAAKADFVPKPGQAKLVFGNLGGGEATVSINKQTIKIAGGAGGPQSPKPPMLDLPPGKYQYTLKVAGGPTRTNQIEIDAGDTWGLMVAPGGDVLPLHMY